MGIPEFRRPPDGIDEEVALFRAFVIPGKRERYIAFLATPKHRLKATADLDHFRDFDPRWIVQIPDDSQDSQAIFRLLRSRGAGSTCHVMSSNRAIDGKRLPLASALGAIIGVGDGSLLSCIPAQLAYFEGEGPSDRFILARTVSPGKR